MIRTNEWYRVIEYDLGTVEDLEEWLNEQKRMGRELVSFSGNLFVFRELNLVKTNPFLSVEITKDALLST